MLAFANPTSTMGTAEFASDLDRVGLPEREPHPVVAERVSEMEGLPLPNGMGLFAFFVVTMLPITIIFALLVLVARL